MEIVVPKIDNIVLNEIPRWKHDVLKKDKDKVFIIDGREGTGKSTLAQQLAMNLDPDFNINKIVFTADQFKEVIRSPERKKGDCIILDEAYFSINSRSAMTNVNKSLVGLATEMRQLNLFIIICLPTYFDLDRYFALFRTDVLIHCYLNKKGDRGQYILFGWHKKKELYLKGKKTYSYGFVKSPYPPCSFNKGYVVDEELYREKKKKSFVEEKQALGKLERHYYDLHIRLMKAMLSRGFKIEDLMKVTDKTKDCIRIAIDRYDKRELGTTYAEGSVLNTTSEPHNSNFFIKEGILEGEDETTTD